MDIVFYHKSCPDGWCAAYIASKRYPEAELIPLDHGLTSKQLDDLYEKVIGKNVLVLDYSFRTRGLNDMFDNGARSGGGSFQIYDHHKTAQAVLEGAPYAVFDMKRSGAGLAWDYLFGKDKPLEDRPRWVSGDGKVIKYIDDIPYYEKRPWFVDYVEDRDLWNWKLPDSKSICAYLGTLEFTKEAWDQLDGWNVKGGFEMGRGALAHINHYVREVVKQTQTGVLQGYRTAVLNVPYLNCSEIGNELAKTHDVSLTWFERGDGMVQFSLRSIGDIDVSAIAKVFNGGGHRNASGFQLDLANGRILIDRVLGRNQIFEEERLSGGCVK